MLFLFVKDRASVPLASTETFLILTGPRIGLGKKEVCLAKIFQIFLSHSTASPNLRTSSGNRFLLLTDFFFFFPAQRFHTDKNHI